MNILVIGASAGTGALCVKAALARGHHVKAFARTPAKLNLSDPKLTLVPGDFHDERAVDDAVKGMDAVIITASTTPAGFKQQPDFFSRGTRFCVAAMKKHGVKRLVLLSALGVGDSRASMGAVRAFVLDLFLKRPFLDHDVQEKLARVSGLEVVIARPSRLTDGPARGAYVKSVGFEGIPFAISRADVADFLIDSCTDDQFVGKSVHLGG